MDSEPTHLSPAVKREREEDLRDPNTTSTLARKRSVSAESSHIPSPAASEARDPLFKKTGAALEPPSATMSFSSSSSDRTEPLLVSPTRPSGPEQLEKINVLRQKPLQQGDKWFIIAEPWYQRWSTACGGPQTLIDKSKANEPVSLSEVGPIDNRPVRYPGTSRLLQAPVEGTDAEFVPEEAWQLLQSWYGIAVPEDTLERRIISYGGEARIEVFPPTFEVFRICGEDEMPDVLLQQPPRFTYSGADTLGKLRTAVIEKFNISNDQLPLSFYRISEQTAQMVKSNPHEGIGYAPASILQLFGTPERCGEGSGDQTLIDAQLDEGLTYLAVDTTPSKLINPSDDSNRAQPSSSTDTQNLPEAHFGSTASVPFSFGDNKFVNSLGPAPSQEKKLYPPRRIDVTTIPLGSKQTTGRDLMEPGTRMTRSTSQQAVDRAKGLCGLSNLGNTCFMNSALQCLSNTPELREYFQTGAYRGEINRDNPLGMSGKVAEEFGHLIKKLWSNNGSFSPREFKAMIGRFRPMFIGWSQQDSQELLSFLLDGLHEDLNRIYKKPATAKPEWEGGTDLDMMKMAKESWRLFKLRNDSVIVDLFQGMYRSTVVCPDCQKVSITFDAFTSLTLPLPPKEWTGEVFVMPADPAKPRYRVCLKIPQGTSILRAKAMLGEQVELPATHLFAAESFSSKFWKSWVDEDAATDINATPDHNKQPQDYITFYELPFPYEQLPSSPHREGSKTMNDRNRDRESGKVVVPVTLTTSSKTSYGSASHFGLPFMLGMKREEATSFEAVHEALARQIARLSRRGADFFEVNESASGPDETADSAANSTDPATATKKAGDFSPPTLPPVGTPVVKKGFKILVNSKSDRRKIVPLGSSNSTVSANLVSLRERIKGDAEPMPGSLPGNEASMDETDDELKKRYEDATPPEPVIETGDTIVVEFSEASHKYFFGDDNHLYNHDQTQVIGKPPAPSQKRSSVSLDACLDEFSKTEQLDAMNTWYCPACKDHKEATKQVSLWSLPDILVIHLKRFSASRYGSRQKITDLVDFPQEGLDLAPRVIERQLANRIAKLEGPTVVQENTLDDTESMTYDLYAVDNHYGGMGGGHYTAYARNALDNRWYDFDDTRVSAISPEQAKTSAAYLLFYRRRTTRPFGGKTREVISEANSSTPEAEKEDVQEEEVDPALPPYARDQNDIDNDLPDLVSTTYRPTFGVADDVERSRQWSSASSSLAQGGTPSPRSSRDDSDGIPWDNNDFEPSINSPPSPGSESSSDPRG